MNLGQRSIVSRVADAIRDQALASDEGQLIGSEEELLSKHGVSRPTLRLAAALVAREHLLTVRRGVRGGYFARRPDAGPAGHMAELYLRWHKTSSAELVKALVPIKLELAQLAALQGETGSRALLRDYVEPKQVSIECPAIDIHDEAFWRLVATTAGNRPLGLFMDMLTEMLRALVDAEAILDEDPLRLQRYCRHRMRLATAIVAGDAEVARLEAERLVALTTEWLLEALGEGDRPDENEPEQYRLTGSSRRLPPR